MRSTKTHHPLPCILAFLVLAAVFATAPRAEQAQLVAPSGGGAVGTATDGAQLHGAIGSRGIGGSSGASSSANVTVRSGYYPAQFAPPLENSALPAWRLYSFAEPALPVFPALQLFRPFNLSFLVSIWRLP
jgi:hypothetical protein